VDVETPLSAESFPAMLAVHFLVNPFLSLMDGSYMLCHMALSGEHFITVGTRNTLHPTMLGLSHVHVADVAAEICLGGEYPDTKMAPLVGRVVTRGRTGNRNVSISGARDGANFSSHYGGHTFILLFNINGGNDGLHLLDVVVGDVLVVGDVGGGGGRQGGHRGQGDQFRR